MKVLCVAEKPSMAKSIATFLSGGRYNVHNSRNQYIKNYEFEFEYNRQPCQVVVTSVLGHLMENEFPQEHAQWRLESLRELFTAPIIKDTRKDMKAVADNLKSQARYASVLAIWTDCDREGENIGSEVIQVCSSANQRLQVRRAQFSVVQKREIVHAWNSMRDLDYAAAIAVDTRSELDLRIGAVFSRFQTLRLKKRFQELEATKVLSYGPCQFPTLGFIVDAYNANQNFVSEPFWAIHMSISKDNVESKFNWDKGHLFDQQLTVILYEACVENPIASITSVNGHPTSKWTPLPLTTVELQKMGSRVLKLSSDRIMTIAESLYNQGFISYPRTETDVFEDNFALRPLIERQVSDPRWGQYAQSLLDGKFRKPRKGKNNDHAHPPIHPVKDASHLEGDDKRIYELVTRRFLACCSEAAKGYQTTVTAKIANETFKTSGLQILERNYLEVYTYDKWSDAMIPTFEQGQTYTPSVLEVRSGNTAPPSLLTEADLIGLMDKSGIGTDATIHEHIKKVQERGYANKEGQYFYPSTLGMALISAYDEMNIEFSLSKPHMRSRMESDMKAICQGRKTKDQVVQTVVEMYQLAFETVSNQSHLLEEACTRYFGHAPNGTNMTTGPQWDMGTAAGTCTECGRTLYLKTTKEGKRFVGCSGYPVCRRAKFFPDAVIQDVKVTQEPCHRCAVGERMALKLEFLFKAGSVPPSIPTRHVTCVWCDQELEDFFSMYRGRSGNVPSTVGTLATPNPASGSNGPMSSQMPPMRNTSTHQNRITVEPLNVPVCDCGIPCASLTVKKQGPNEGRLFFACSKPQTDGTKCNVFHWGDAILPTPSSMPPFSSTSIQINQSFQNPPSSSISLGPNCNCGVPSVQKTVRKEGPNEGRKFFCCLKQQADSTRCDFFLWESEYASGGGNGSVPPQRMEMYRDFSSSSGTSTKPKCQCNLFATTKTVMKDGPNKGRSFHTCAKASARCQFFEWVDGDASSSFAGHHRPLQDYNEASREGSRGSNKRSRGGSTRGRGAKRGRGRGAGRGKSKNENLFPSMN